MNCPHCGAPVEIPKAAFYAPGEHTAACENGHQVKVTSEKGRQLSDEERARIAQGTHGQPHETARPRRFRTSRMFH